jgi:hypothetical protein
VSCKESEGVIKDYFRQSLFSEEIMGDLSRSLTGCTIRIVQHEVMGDTR